MRTGILLAAALAATLFGVACATQQQMLQDKQQMAIQAAESRARFEMNCADVTASVLSDEMTQPVLEGPYLGGVERAEFTIGVAGCGRRDTYVVVCPEGGGGCFAADPHGGG
jgi:hypothetical protein